MESSAGPVVAHRGVARRVAHGELEVVHVDAGVEGEGGKGVAKRVRVNGGESGAPGEAFDDRVGGAVREVRLSVHAVLGLLGVEQQRAGDPAGDVGVDRGGDRRGEHGEADLAAFAFREVQDSAAVFFAEVLDASAAGFTDAQAEEAEAAHLLEQLVRREYLGVLPLVDAWIDALVDEAAQAAAQLAAAAQIAADAADYDAKMRQAMGLDLVNTIVQIGNEIDQMAARYTAAGLPPHLIAGSGHSPMVEKPDQFLAAIGDFVR